MSAKPSYAAPIQPVLSLLRDRLLPWLQEAPLQRILVGQAAPKIVTLASQPGVEGVEIGSRPRRGRAIGVKASRVYGFANTVARWPEDKLVVAQLPIAAFVLRGTAELHLGDHYLRIGEGHLLIIPAGLPYSDGTTSHLAATDANGSCDMLWFFPWSGGVVCNVCHSRGRQHLTLGEGENCFVTSKQTESYLSAALEEAVSRDSRFGLVCHNLLTVSVLLLIREIEAGHFSQPGRLAAEEREIPTSHNPISQAQAYVNSHLDKALTIDRLARMSYMSRAQFTKRFRAVTGKSFSQFLTEQRLAEAQRLLRDTELPVKVISEFVGLQPMHLRRLFRQHCRTAPTAFRDAQQLERSAAQSDSTSNERFKRSPEF